MKIIFFTQEDPFFVKIFFEEFFKKYKKTTEIKSVVISKTMGKRKIKDLAKQMFGLYGYINFVKMSFKYVLYKINSKIYTKKGVKRKEYYSIKQIAKAYGVNVIERSDLNSKEFISQIKKYDADLFISVASPIIFKEQLINVPKIDCINIHNAPLPKYRGMLPNFWQLYHDEIESGITVHKIEIGIDTGRIIKQIYVPIEPGETLHQLIEKTKREDAGIIIDVIEEFKNNKVIYTEMEKNKGDYFTFPTKKDLQEFRKKGKRVV